MSDTLRFVRRLGLRPSSRDRISVDLRGLKAALCDRAQAACVSPSQLVRATLAEALGPAEATDAGRPAPVRRPGHVERTRLCLRMSREQARATTAAARRAGMHLGDFVAGLVADVPVLSAGRCRSEHIASLTSSSAELATLSRNLDRLTTLLRQANVEQARPYRAMLDTLAGEIRSHLEIAARVLADLQPSMRRAGGADRPAL
jgi:hypothetical protein